MLDSVFKSLGLESRIERISVALLLLSGVLHAIPFLLATKDWEDPTSFRKAILFGVSTGLTLYSCLWTLRTLQPKPNDLRLSQILCTSLVIEVALITLQCWRNTESHFNTKTIFDECIEQAMLLFISIAMWFISKLTWRTWTKQFRPNTPAPVQSAATWGMSLLLLSGLIGFGISFLGYLQMENGLPPYRWPAVREISTTSTGMGQGILKFPHGAALHAIQLLALVAWTVRNTDPKTALWAVRLTATAHVFWLSFAIYQTAQGRSRFDVDPTSTLLMIATILCSMTAGIFILKRFIKPDLTSGEKP